MYFDLALCVALNSIAFYQSEDLQDFELYFASFSDTLNSLTAMIFTVFVLVFPFWVYAKIARHFHELDDPKIVTEFGMMYEDLNTRDFHSA
jgi:hypothetical protein